MVFNKKHLKALGELNKKVKSYFKEEYIILPDGSLYGMCDKKVSSSIIMNFHQYHTLGFDCLTYALVVKTEELNKIFNSKVKASDISEVVMENTGYLHVDVKNIGKIVFGTLLFAEKLPLGEYEKLQFVINRDNFDVCYNLSQNEFKDIYDSKNLNLDIEGFRMIINRKTMDSFTHYSKNAKMEVRAKSVNNEFFDGDVILTHVDKKLEDYLTIHHRYRFIHL